MTAAINTVKRLCITCGSDGPFYRRGRNRKSFHTECCSCHCLRIRRRNKTPQGRASKAWNSITERAGDRAGYNPTYVNVKLLMTRDAFMAWAVPAFTKWLIDHPDEGPTVDRIDSNGHYAIGNLQLVTRAENTRKRPYSYNYHAPAGMSWCSRCQAYKVIADFSKASRNYNGLSLYCRNCLSIRYREAKERLSQKGQTSAKNN